jgi:SAM-dependent methyltransferase
MGAVTVDYRGFRLIRDFWNHYTEHPDLYDRFAIDSALVVQELDRRLGFAGRRALSIACGTGKDSFEISRLALSVVGIDMSANMLRFAAGRRRELRARNVSFVRSVAEGLPFRDGAFDCALSIHGAPFMGWGWEETSLREALRVVRPEGWVAFVSELPHEAMPDRITPSELGLGELLEPFGFGFHRVDVEVDYGSVDEAAATWGSIYGERAVDRFLDEDTSRVVVPLGIWSRTGS